MYVKVAQMVKIFVTKLLPKAQMVKIFVTKLLPKAMKQFFSKLFYDKLFCLAACTGQASKPKETLEEEVLSWSVYDILQRKRPSIEVTMTRQHSLFFNCQNAPHQGCHAVVYRWSQSRRNFKLASTIKKHFAIQCQMKSFIKSTRPWLPYPKAQMCIIMVGTQTVICQINTVSSSVYPRGRIRQ